MAASRRVKLLSISHVVVLVTSILYSVGFLEISAVPFKLFSRDAGEINPQQTRFRPTAMVVGAGPVGLYTAAKLTEKGFDVKIVEKREEYMTRQQVVAVLHEEARAILNSRDLAGDGCIHFPAAITKYPQCLDTSRRDELIAQSNGNLDASNFVQSFTTKQIQLGFLVEFFKARELRRLNFEKFETTSFADISPETLDKFDLIVCADGTNSACRDTLIPNNTPQRFREGDPLAPDAYGGTLILEAKYIPEHRREELLARTTAQQLSGPQHLYRGFLASDGQLYIGIAITQEEYRSVEGLNQKSPEFRAAFLKNIGHRVSGALDFYEMSDLRDAVLEHGIFTAFPIVLRHQDRSKFAVVRPRPLSFGESNGDQVVVIVGDAAISSHFFSGSGLTLGMQVADAAMSFLDSKAFGPLATDMFVWEVKSLFGHVGKRRKIVENIVTQINEAASNVAVAGKQKSLMALPPWVKNPSATGTAVVVPTSAAVSAPSTTITSQTSPPSSSPLASATVAPIATVNPTPRVVITTPAPNTFNPQQQYIPPSKCSPQQQQSRPVQYIPPGGFNPKQQQPPTFNGQHQQFGKPRIQQYAVPPSCNQGKCGHLQYDSRKDGRVRCN
ncbi:hypothetical protein HK102_012255 [Quaeritorhiza haematococci]|nr:hypothetical protein HK102_012255 [Quaeritorhiza haematococci]